MHARRGVRRRGATFAAVTMGVSVVLLGVGFGAATASSGLMAVPETGVPGYLSLRSNPFPAQFLSLSPGDVRHWQIAADITEPYSTLTLQVEREGELVEHPRGLMVEVRRCSTPWVVFPADPRCAEAQTVVLAQSLSSTTFGATGTVTRHHPRFDAGAVWNDRSQYFLVSLWIPDTPQNRGDASLMNLTAHLGFGFHAQGAAPPPPVRSEDLPVTGADPLGPALLALGAIGVGVSFARIARHPFGRRHSTPVNETDAVPVSVEPHSAQGVRS